MNRIKFSWNINRKPNTRSHFLYKLIIMIDTIPNPHCVIWLKIVLLFPHSLKYKFAGIFMKRGIYFLTEFICFYQDNVSEVTGSLLSLGLMSFFTLSFSTLSLCFHLETKVTRESHRNSRKSTWFPRHRKMKPFPATASQEKSQRVRHGWATSLSLFTL